jgi:Lar family restriction alleviation protein
MARTKLKPCPFCGSNKVEEYGSPEDEDMGYVACECGASVNGYHEPAAQAWNQRVHTKESGKTSRNSGLTGSQSSPKLPSLRSVKKEVGFGSLKESCQAGVVYCYEAIKRLGNIS